MKKELIPLDKSLNFQIFRLSLLLGRELKKALKEFDLTPERWQVLAALWNSSDPLSQTVLGKLTLKDKPSISRLVDSMVRAGWLIRNLSDHDGRTYLIRPSAKANSSRERIITALYDHFEPFSQKLEFKNRQKLFPLILKYIAVIEGFTDFPKVRQ